VTVGAVNVVNAVSAVPKEDTQEVYIREIIYIHKWARDEHVVWASLPGLPLFIEVDTEVVP
jgi:hypothetical protein